MIYDVAMIWHIYEYNLPDFSLRLMKQDHI